MQFENKDDEIEIDLREFFLVFLDHLKMIVLSTVIMGAIAFVISRFILTPEYESTSQLYVLTKSTSITSLADVQMGTSLTNDYMVVVKGRPVAEQVIENLKLKENYEEFLSKVTLNNPADSRILEISVRDTDPKRAKEIADELAKVSSVFIAEKMDQDSPTLIQKGYADGDPITPNIMRNVIRGGVIGFLLALGIVVVSYLLNDSIMSSEDIEEKLGLHMLGSLPLEEKEEELYKKPKKKKLRKKSA